MHHELWASALLLAGVAVGWVSAVAVGQEPPVRTGALGILVSFALGCLVLSTVLRASRLKWVGRTREFEAAARVPDGGGRPRRAAFTPRMLGLLLLPALCVFVIRDTGVVVVLLAMGLDWLGKAVVGAGWEHGNGRRLWLAPDPGQPWRLSHSPADPAPTGG
ncbi:hypothetical protein ABT065_20170 [Streptomyces sp. NPDC002764]|uniref:hypothetical protein n=1 Tax=Streptomyces sp. NPDC002764 TaxID=3154428 RepID=UPI003331E110